MSRLWAWLWRDVAVPRIFAICAYLVAVYLVLLMVSQVFS